MRSRLFMGASVLLLALATLDSSGESTSVYQVDADRILDSVASLAAPPNTEFTRVQRFSSHDRQGGNQDGGLYGPQIATSPVNSSNFVRQETDGLVLAETAGPGCLTHVWFTGIQPTLGELADVGRLQFFVDGHRQPTTDIPATQLFSGADKRFPFPLVANSLPSAGGNYSYVPLCFQHGLKVRATGAGEATTYYYQFDVARFSPATQVRSGWPTPSGLATALRSVKATGQPPAGARRVALTGPSTVTATIPNNSTVLFLDIRLAPFTIQTLRATRLIVRSNGEQHPDVDASLAPLLGDGISLRKIRSRAFGMDPAAKRGYISLPMPLPSGGSITIRPPAGAKAQASLYTAPEVAERQRLHVSQQTTVSRVGHDIRVLDRNGSGRLAAWILDITGDQASASGPMRAFMEGDDRIHIDGARSPALYGTGTEDIFNGGFYYRNGPNALPWSGGGPELSGEGRGLQSQYRVYTSDAPMWGSSIRMGVEHGPGNDRPDRSYTNTVYFYAGPRNLITSDTLDLGSPASRASHRVQGGTPITLESFYEGDLDGTLPNTTIATWGPLAVAPPGPASSESVRATGLKVETVLRLHMAARPDNCGVLLTRTLDNYGPSSAVLTVNGHRLTWATAQSNPSKRWLDDSLFLPPTATRGRRALDLVLTPTSGDVTAYRFTAQSASC